MDYDAYDRNVFIKPAMRRFVFYSDKRAALKY